MPEGSLFVKALLVFWATNSAYGVNYLGDSRPMGGCMKNGTH